MKAKVERTLVKIEVPVGLLCETEVKTCRFLMKLDDSEFDFCEAFRDCLDKVGIVADECAPVKTTECILSSETITITE